MRKGILGIPLLLVLAVFAWASNDPWKDKPYQQWDPKDIQHVLSNSPWSKTVQVDAKWEPQGTQQAPQAAPPENVPTSGGSGGSMGRRADRRWEDDRTDSFYRGKRHP